MRGFLRRCFLSLCKGETGQALPATLALFAIASLVMVPYLNLISTNIKLEKLTEDNVAGFYAAEAGIEDACWEIINNAPETLPYTYSLSQINGMSVNVTIQAVTQIAGQEVGEDGIHEGWMKISKAVVYASGSYFYTLTIENNGGGNIKVEQMMVDLPPGLEYTGTSGNISISDPQVIGNSTTGITLFWDIPSPYYTLGPGASEDQAFELSGEPDISGVEGHVFVKASREDVGTVWDADSKPYTVIAQAHDASGDVIATITAGVWAGQGNLEISCWLVD